MVAAGCGGHRAADGCPGARLAAAQGSAMSEATGQHTLLVEVVDRGAPCTVEGVPKVELLGARGKTLGFTYKDTGDQMIASAQPRAVHLAPGRPGLVELNKYRCDIRAVDGARAVRLTFSHLRPLTLRLEGGTSLDWCPTEKPSSVVDVSALLQVPPDASRVRAGDTRRRVIAVFGRPVRTGPRCSVWRWAPTPLSGADGARVCFANGRVASVATAEHG